MYTRVQIRSLCKVMSCYCALGDFEDDSGFMVRVFILLIMISNIASIYFYVEYIYIYRLPQITLSEFYLFNIELEEASKFSIQVLVLFEKGHRRCIILFSGTFYGSCDKGNIKATTPGWKF